MILIKNGLLIDPANDLEGAFDLLIEDGVVKDIQPPNSFEGVQVQQTINAENMWVVPGLIDLHVHLREPGYEEKETILSGSQAAALGGFTSVCCMPNTKPANHNSEITQYILGKAKEANLVRVLPVGAVSIDLKGEVLAPLQELKEAGCVAFSDDGMPIYNAALMREALVWASANDAVICCHEEDKELCGKGCMNESELSNAMDMPGRPKVAEEVMIARDIELARVTGAKIHICHISTARAVDLVRRAKNDGVKITTEVAAHHLLLSENAISEHGTAAKMNPPLREEEDCSALLAALKDGTIDALASDHAPHEKAVKDIELQKAAPGLIGLQSSLPHYLSFVRDGKLSRSKAIAAMTSGPARVFSLEQGTLSKGSPADVTIISPDQRWTYTAERIASLSKNTPFLGDIMQGVAHTVLVNGEIIVENQKLKTQKLENNIENKVQ
ncbi:dihydroorotase [Oligoflexia bacterium]|nr:dihydroorotase [Oligoflexia bacterium]